MQEVVLTKIKMLLIEKWLNLELKNTDLQNTNQKVKENKIIGLTAKPVSKMKSIMRKMENQLEAERKAAKEKKESKKS